jgi:hypothetical protein
MCATSQYGETTPRQAAAAQWVRDMEVAKLPFPLFAAYF